MIDSPDLLEMSALLWPALDQLEEGVSIFDASRHLVFCNAPFRELRDYPESVCSISTHISELYRHNAHRGDYGDLADIEAEVARRVELSITGGARAFDQVIAGGVILYVRYAPLVNGALLFSYEDVTEKRATEAKLTESNERHALAMEAVNEGVYNWNIETGEIYYSPRVRKLLGFGSDDLRTVGDWTRCIHPDDISLYRDAIKAHLRGDVNRLEVEYRYRAPDGSTRWVRQHGLARRNAEGRAYRMAGSTGDVTEEKAMALELEALRARLLDAIETLSEGFALFDHDDRLVMCNSVYRRYFSELNELVVPGTPFSTIIEAAMERGMFPLANGNEEHWLEELLQRRGSTSGVRQQYLNSGLWLQVSDHRMSDGGLVSVYVDITEVKERESELSDLVHKVEAARDEAEQERKRFLEAIEAMSEGFVLYDVDDRLVLCNEVYRSLYQVPSVQALIRPGTPRETIVRAGVEHGLFVAALDREEEWIAQHLHYLRSREGVREQHLKGGQWLQISDQRMSDGGRVSIYTDITELKRGQEELRTAKDAAEGALEELRLAQRSLVQSEKMASLGQLTAGIAHEIKNPLHFVNNFSKSSMSLLEELDEALLQARSTVAAATQEEIDDLVETLKEDLTSIVEHSERADGIVKGMLLHSRGDAGGRQIVDLNALLDESVNLAYHGQRAATPGFNVSLDKEFDADMTEFEVVSQEITRVFVNLLANAFYAVRTREREAGKEFAPCVRIATRRTAADRAEIRIRDNGVGMSRETMDKLFTPFFTTKPPGEGTGLGLSISHDIVVEQHGGAMNVESVQGEFTEFVLELPRKMPPAASG